MRERLRHFPKILLLISGDGLCVLFQCLKSAFINKLIKCIYESYATYCPLSGASRELAQHCPNKAVGKIHLLGIPAKYYCIRIDRKDACDKL